MGWNGSKGATTHLGVGEVAWEQTVVPSVSGLGAGATEKVVMEKIMVEKPTSSYRDSRLASG